MNDLECPYCEEKLDVCHDDGFGYEEDVAHQMQCSNCEKNFIFYTSVSFYYDSCGAPCLNGEAHKYKPTTTIPKAYTRMRCEWCDEERALTDEERRILDIPEKIKEEFRNGKNDEKESQLYTTVAAERE